MMASDNNFELRQMNREYQSYQPPVGGGLRLDESIRRAEEDTLQRRLAALAEVGFFLSGLLLIFWFL